MTDSDRNPDLDEPDKLEKEQQAQAPQKKSAAELGGHEEIRSRLERSAAQEGVAPSPMAIDEPGVQKQTVIGLWLVIAVVSLIFISALSPSQPGGSNGAIEQVTAADQPASAAVPQAEPSPQIPATQAPAVGGSNPEQEAPGLPATSTEKDIQPADTTLFQNINPERLIFEGASSSTQNTQDDEIASSADQAVPPARPKPPKRAEGSPPGYWLHVPQGPGASADSPAGAWRYIPYGSEIAL